MLENPIYHSFVGTIFFLCFYFPIASFQKRANMPSKARVAHNKRNELENLRKKLVFKQTMWPLISHLNLCLGQIHCLLVYMHILYTTHTQLSLRFCFWESCIRTELYYELKERHYQALLPLFNVQCHVA